VTDQAGVPYELYQEIQEFYARQIRLLGAGDIERWAMTFTTDAVFEQNARPDRQFARSAKAVRRGRADIAAAASGATAQRRDDSVVRRYWLGMLAVMPGPGDALRTRYYGALVNTLPAREVDVFLSTHGTDELVREGATWSVRHRVIGHDDVPEPTQQVTA
jgi:3-phenylpropionate/cinnamic acid dioxygenase small subunit